MVGGWCTFGIGCKTLSAEFVISCDALQTFQNGLQAAGSDEVLRLSPVSLPMEERK